MHTTIEHLVRQIELLEDYEQVSQALMEVVHLQPVVGGRLALNLLRSTNGDAHLRAFAFSMLYRADRSTAFQYARDSSGVCEAPVFSAMLDEVAEDVGLVPESLDLQQMVSYLRLAISHRSDLDAEEMKRSVRNFWAVYGDHS